MAGYEAMASHMAQYPEVAIFRRFRGLQAKVLLFLQAELVHLEYDLQDITEVGLDHEKAQNSPVSVTEGITRCWRTSREPKTSYAKAHNEKVWEINNTLQAYYMNVKRWNDIQSFGFPSSRNADHLRNWLLDANRPLDGTDSEPWLASAENELMVLSQENDKLDNWLCTWIAPIWHRLIGERLQRRRLRKQGVDPEAQGNFFRYNDSVFMLLGDIACVMLSTLLLTSAVIGLYYVHDMLDRLIFIAAFTLLFSLVLMFVARCRRVEVFGATAAFCAVLVVFVQNIPQSK